MFFPRIVLRVGDKKIRLLGLRFLLIAILAFAAIWNFFSWSDQESRKLLDINDFEFLVVPKNICTQKSIEETPTKRIIVFVHSARTNFLSRQTVRETYGSVQRYENWEISVVFLLGLDFDFQEDAESAKLLELEIRGYDDILMGTIPDTYHHLSHKHVMGYRYASTYCPPSAFYLKADDDTLVNIFFVINYLQKRLDHPEMLGGGASKYYYYCHPITLNKPIRAGQHNGSFKVFEVSYDEFAGDVYPDYCGLSTYITTVETVKRIYQISGQISNILPMEDAFVTGVLREYVNKKEVETSEKIGFENAKIFDYGWSVGDIFYKLEKNEEYLAVIVETRNPNLTCKLWRKMHKGQGLTRIMFGDCESLWKFNLSKAKDNLEKNKFNNDFENFI